MPTDESVHRARRNGDAAGQRVAPGERPASVDQVVDLLVNAMRGAHPGVRRAARALLTAMDEYGPWRVLAGRHRGGTGSAGRRPDWNAHITLRVGNNGYHLQIAPDGHLRRITGDRDVELVPPWLPPGAPVPHR